MNGFPLPRGVAHSCRRTREQPKGSSRIELVQPEVEACCPPLRAVELAPEGAVCSCDLVEPVGKSQPTVSHHLKILREAGLVTSERRGVNIWYAAVPAALELLRDALAARS